MATRSLIEILDKGLVDCDPNGQAGNRHFEEGNFEEAIAAYERLKKESKREIATIYEKIGDCLIRLERPEEAEAALKRTVELMPHSGYFHCKLGDFYRAQKRLDEARAVYEKATELVGGEPAKEKLAELDS